MPEDEASETTVAQEAEEIQGGQDRAAASESVSEIVAAPLEVPVGSAESAAQTPRRHLWLLDLLLFLVLFSVSIPVRMHFTHGDLFSDEADYALASTRGLTANRFDLPSSPKDPDSLIRTRHFHAPLTVEIIGFARRWGAEDRTIRMPFVLAGAASVGLVYLCGAILFEGKREIAVACGIITIFTSPVIRMASHGLPWAFIILELLLLLWTLVSFARSRKPFWLAAALCSLGLLFVTSEVFFVVLPAVGLCAPFLLWPDLSNRPRLHSIGIALLVGLAGAIAITAVFWPAGFRGDAIRMLRHYMVMSHSEEFPVNIGSDIYTVAPKWAYLYWYWYDYRPFFVWYALGLAPFLILLPLKKLPAGGSALFFLTALLTYAAHRAHIIGPEYLAHCLPFFTLIGGYAYLTLARIWRPLGIVGIAVAGFYLAQWRQVRPLPGMDRRAQISRWTDASRYLSHNWRSGDRLMIGPQPADVALWYIPNVGGARVHIGAIGQLPVHDPKPAFLHKLSTGYIAYVMTSSAFEDFPEIDFRTLHILRSWDVVWRSDEHSTGPSRLIIFRSPLRHAEPTQRKPGFKPDNKRTILKR